MEQTQESRNKHNSKRQTEALVSSPN